MSAMATPLSEAAYNERVRWAEDRGVPLWLWPKVSVPSWQEALRAIETLVRQILANGRADQLAGDAAAIGLAAYTSGTGPLLGHWIDTGSMPAAPAVAAVLTQHLEQNAARMKYLAAQAHEALDALARAGINVIVLKGMHTAFSCFPHPATRSLSDIDLFIAPRDKHAAGRILQQLGYTAEAARTIPDEQFWRGPSSPVTPQSIDYVHANDPWGVDLHTSANRRYAQASPVIPLDRLIVGPLRGRSTLHPHAEVLEPASSLLFLACHASCGFGNLRMIRLVELAYSVMLHEGASRTFWREVTELGTVTGTLPHAYAALRLTDSLRPGLIPAEVLANCRRGVPAAAIRVIERLTPAGAHAITRCSVEERYMWTASLFSKLKQAAHDIFPSEMPAGARIPALKRRMLRVLRGTVSVTASQSRPVTDG